MDKKEKILLDEVRQNFASVVWTHKIQEKQADIYAKKYNHFEWANIVFAGITSCGLISTLFCDNYIAKFVTTLFSFITFCLSTYLKDFNLRNMEHQHRVAANQFIIIRNQLLHIITELHTEKDFDLVEAEYQSIMSDLNKLYIKAPSTTNEAVEKASKALKCKNEYTYTDAEIDHFLPKNLQGGL
ncbi:SLATT domain-containing protein [uncultured Megasphaera sp.]|uniref:SLATT domain-containing protein n=1 Tax=uncultured Megasphaera sp. TaxID=165188 RepID=UPI0025F6C7D8|nr:SLATT domain-containing protein [uncultured Megasphaera sp.]